MTRIPADKTGMLHFRVTGNGPAIVLLHGFLESSEIWKNFARRLSKSFRVILIDLPGHGASGCIGGEHTMDAMAEAVHFVLINLGIKKCVMAGHSMGGYVTLAFAEKYPRMLKGLALFHSHAAADSPETAANRERTIALVEKDRLGFIKNFVPDLFDPANLKEFSRDIIHLKSITENTTKEGVIAAIRGMKNRPDRQHVLMNSRVPVLFIIGKNDARIPLSIIIPQTLLPAHSETLLLDHVGHMGFIEASAKTFDALQGFAQRVLSC
ncbi:MAG TPA: alpha/beta hydrolase [Bacteroidales bacterium]|nr:alpha/beta hydrolase [Bacteroidales bacterium]HPI85684.1 alpha/beta hydrolase [Bacteroidales bacterium]